MYIRLRKIYYLLLCSLSMVASCTSNSNETTEAQADHQPNAGDIYNITLKQFETSKMSFGKIDQQVFQNTIKANGIFDVHPQNIANVSSYFSGYVKTIKLLPGMTVKKGQILFTLENPDFVEIQKEFLEAQSMLSYLESDYLRQKDLAKENITSQKNYLKAEADYKVTKVKLESLKKRLILMNIDPDHLVVDDISTTIQVLCPISGHITNVNITQGIYIHPEDVAISIVNTDDLHIELRIFEKDITKVKIGQPFTFNIQNDPTNKYMAKVFLVNKNVDEQTRTVAVHGHLTNENIMSMFNPGIYVEADIQVATAEKPAIPKIAVVDIDGVNYVLALKKKSGDSLQFEKMEIMTGVSNDEFIEVLNVEDFNKNTEFLVEGAYHLISSK